MLIEEEAKKAMKEAMDSRYKGNYGDALLKFRELTDSLFDVDERWADLLFGEVIHQFGVTCQNMKDWSAAFDNFSIATRYRRRIGDLIGAAYTIFQIPMCRLARGDKVENVTPDFERAEEAINAAIPEVVKASDSGTLGNMYQNLAYIFQQRGDLQRAVGAYYKALAYRKEVGDKRGEGLTLARMAECYKELGNMPDAKVFAKDALAIFREIGDVNRIAQVEKVLQEIEEIEYGIKREK